MYPLICVDDLAYLTDMMPMQGMPTILHSSSFPLGGFFKGGEGSSVQRMGGPSVPAVSLTKPDKMATNHSGSASGTGFELLQCAYNTVWVLTRHEHLPIGCVKQHPVYLRVHPT